MNPSDLKQIEQLVLTCIKDDSQTVDAIFDGLDELGVFPRLRHSGGAAFVRGLRRGPDGDLVASALLRVLAVRYVAVDESLLRGQIVEFLDGQYADPLAAFYRRPKKRNAYEVLSAFAPVVPAVEERATAHLKQQLTLEGTDRYREGLMRLLNSAAGRVIFRPFLPASGWEAELADLFGAAAAVRSAQEKDAIEPCCRRAEAATLRLQDVVETVDSVYARLLLQIPSQNVFAEVSRRLALASPPGRLAFEIDERPMPLLEPGVTCVPSIFVLNEGDAPATDVHLTITSEGPETEVIDAPHRMGVLDPNTRHVAGVTLAVIEPTARAELHVSARWTNPDHTVGRASSTLALEAHAVHIDWPRLEGTEPFAPYPVERPEHLVGRGRQLAGLIDTFTNTPLANLYVTGQRRVGKTSLVRVAVNALRTSAPKLVVASVELGEVRAGEGLATIALLGRKLAQRAIRSAGLDSEIGVPTFTDSLAPLTDVVEEIMAWDDDMSFLFVVDEFDELPHETYRRDGPGDALFVPMRSLAQKPNVGWLLVGGEKMPFIRDEQAARLNTFREMSVDYLPFSDGSDAPGFGALLRAGLPREFHIDDAAVFTLYEQSAGNPHFAKEIGATLFNRAVARRDAIVGVTDVERAIEQAASERDVELFAHFWEDGIFESDDEKRRRELQRRAYLLACAEVLRGGAQLQHGRLAQATRNVGLEEGDATRLRTEFGRRGVLTSGSGKDVGVAVPFFAKWLESEGIYKLPPKGVAERAQLSLAEEEERLRISHNEVRRLVKRWDDFEYRGRRITRDDVDSWLAQFESPLEKRLAFRLLERLKLISDRDIFEGLRRLHRLVTVEGRLQMKRNQQAFSHLFVSALGGAGGSGESFAYSYRQANNINGSNVLPRDALVDRLLARHEVRSVVLVDDFIGGGGTAVKALEPIAKRAGELAARPAVQWSVFAVTGTPQGVDAILRSPAAQRLGARVELAHPLSEAALPLSADSSVFSDPDERASAAAMLEKYGRRADSPWPKGYDGQAVPVVFPENCPNNAPAILWSDGGDWNPLFLRTGR